MDKELLEEMEKYCSEIQVNPEVGNEAQGRLANQILQWHFKEIFRLARMGLKEEQRHMGLD